MKRRYIILTDKLSAAQENAITKFLKDSGVGYWHWIKNVWLVADKKGRWGSNSLRDELRSLSKATIIVLLQGKNDEEKGWAGYANPKMYEWIKKNWND